MPDTKIQLTDEDVLGLRPALEEFANDLARSATCSSQLEASGLAAFTSLALARVMVEKRLIAPEHFESLLQLAEALFDISSREHLAAWLKPEGKRGAPPLSSSEIRKRAWAAATVSLLMKTPEHDQKSACRLVARTIGETQKTIKHWRDQIIKHDAKDTRLAREYYTYIEEQAALVDRGCDSMLECLRGFRKM